MADQASMGVDPSLLSLNPARTDEGAPAADVDADADEQPQDDTYTVEHLLDYMLYDNLIYSPRETWRDPAKRYEIRYLVKWEGYDDPADNTWEPRENFYWWQPVWDKELAAIEERDRRRQTVNEVKDEAKRLNAEWRKEEKEIKGKGKGKAKAKVKVKANAKGKSKEVNPQKEDEPVKSTVSRRKVSNESRAGSVASSTTAPKTRRTRTNRGPAGSDDIDPVAFQEFLETNAPRGLRSLRVTPPPERDEHGRLIESPSGSEADGAAGSPGAAVTDAAPGSGHASTYAEPQHVAAGEGLGFAGSDGDEVKDEAADGAAQGPALGFADSDESDDDGGAYFPSLVPHQSTLSQQPTPQPVEATAQVGLGFAGSSDEEDEEDRRELELARRAAADAAMDAVPMSAGVSGSGGSEHDAPATKGFAGASDDEDDEAAKPAPTAALGFAADSDEDDAPVLAPNAALGFAAESGEQEARGFAGDSDEVGDKDEDEAMVAAPAAAAGAQAPIALGFADDDDADDEDDDMGFAEAALAPLPQTQTAAAPSRDDVPVPSVKQRKQEQPDQDSATQPAQRPASAVKGTEPTAEEPAGHPTPPVREEPAGQPTPPVRPHKRPSQDDAAPPKFHKVAKVVKPSSTAQARPSKDRSTTPDETPRPPLPKKRVSLDAQQRDKKKKRKKVIADDSEEEAREMSPPVLTQAQLKSLKIAKVGQKHPAPPASAPAATKQAPIAVAVAAAPAQQLAVASGPDRSHQSPPVSNESSSLGSGAQARKARDIFNHGVVRPTSLNGYVRLNGDWLRQKKLSAELTRGETVRYPADVVSEVDKIRHLWSIRPGGHLIEGVRDFDEAMHLVDERGQRRAREAYVTKPPEEGKAGRDKRARQHLNDYHALQLVLSSIDGVKQAEEPKESVTAVFVHASELGQVGRFSGHLKQLEQFRMNEDAVCFSYGEGENRKRAMEPFWRPLTTAFTFTPAAFVRNPARISHLVEKAREAYVPGSCLRAQFPWAPLHYILPGGPFGRADDVVGPHLDLDKNELVNVKSRPHKLGYLKQLPFTWITPRNPSSLKALRFPDKGDHSEYNDRDCHMLSKMPPSKHCALDLEGLQKLVCQWRARYPRIRRWMIIATPDELDKCATAFPGIHLFPLESAEAVLVAA